MMMERGVTDYLAETVNAYVREVAKLQTENERLRAALKEITDLTPFYEPWADIARRALEQKAPQK